MNILNDRTSVSTHTNYVAILIAYICMCGLLYACDDTEFPEDPYATIVGTWKTQLYREYYTADDMPLGQNAPHEYQPRDYPKEVWEFKSDNSYVIHDNKGNIVSYGEFSIYKHFLDIKYVGSRRSIRYSIVNFTETSLWLRITDPGGMYDDKELERHLEITLRKY